MSPILVNTSNQIVCQIIASMSGAMVNLLLIMFLGRLYEKLALKLTVWGEFGILESWLNTYVPAPHPIIEVSLSME